MCATISIVVPVYKSEDFLSQSVESVLNQTYKDLEIILVNDGSPDGSPVICDEYAAKDKRVKVIHKVNGGAADALNCGTYAATSKYLMYLDADDWLETEACDHAISKMNDEQADIVFWSRVKEFKDRSINESSIFSENKVFEGDSLLWLRRRMVGLIGDELKSPSRTDAIASGWGKLYRTSLITERQIRWCHTNEVGSSDVLFTNQVFTHAKRVVYLHKYFNHYRKYNPHSLTANYNFTLFNKYLNLFKHLENNIRENKLGEEFHMALKNRIALSVFNNMMSITGAGNKAVLSEKLNHVKTIFDNDLYQEALSQLDLSYLPLHWKIYFLMCKTKSPAGVLFMTLLMRRIRKYF